MTVLLLPIGTAHLPPVDYGRFKTKRRFAVKRPKPEFDPFAPVTFKGTDTGGVYRTGRCPGIHLRMDLAEPQPGKIDKFTPSDFRFATYRPFSRRLPNGRRIRHGGPIPAAARCQVQRLQAFRFFPLRLNRRSLPDRDVPPQAWAPAVPSPQPSQLRPLPCPQL